jgi:hypothetical protein
MSEFKIPEWATLSNIADTLSLVGLGLTIWLIFQTKALRRSFALRARGPELRKKLEANAKQFPDAIANRQKNLQDYHKLIGSTLGILYSISAKIEKRNDVPVGATIALLNRKRSWLTFYKQKPELAEDDLWTVYANIQIMVSHLAELEKDMLYHE